MLLYLFQRAIDRSQPLCSRISTEIKMMKEGNHPRRTKVDRYIPTHRSTVWDEKSTPCNLSSHPIYHKLFEQKKRENQEHFGKRSITSTSDGTSRGISHVFVDAASSRFSCITAAESMWILMVPHPQRPTAWIDPRIMAVAPSGCGSKGGNTLKWPRTRRRSKIKKQGAQIHSMHDYPWDEHKCLVMHRWGISTRHHREFNTRGQKRLGFLGFFTQHSMNPLHDPTAVTKRTEDRTRFP